MDTTRQNYHDEDWVLGEALLLLERGTTPAVIYAKYPTHEAQLRELFEVIAYLDGAKRVKPQEELVRSILARLPAPRSGFVLQNQILFWRVGVPIFLAALIIIGAVATGSQLPTFFGAQAPQTASTNSDISDAALASDVGVIDDQLDGLNADTAKADQALQYAGDSGP